MTDMQEQIKDLATRVANLEGKHETAPHMAGLAKAVKEVGQ